MTREEFLKIYKEEYGKNYERCWHYGFLKSHRRHKYNQLTKEDTAMYNYRTIDVVDDILGEDNVWGKNIIKKIDEGYDFGDISALRIRGIDDKSNNMFFYLGYDNRKLFMDEKVIFPTNYGIIYNDYGFIFEINCTQRHYDIISVKLCRPRIATYDDVETSIRDAEYKKKVEKFYKENKEKIHHEFKVALFVFKKEHEGASFDNSYFGF